LRADISHQPSIARTIREITTAGGADFFIHLAAYYGFDGENHPEYKTTNIDGTKYILELVKNFNLKLFVFASSVAACTFPKKNEAINESSLPDGKHIYAWSKREGEKLIGEYQDKIPCSIVRLGAVYSDWCEYPPLYLFFKTWFGKSKRARILAGKGTSAIPYIHIRDVVTFFRQVLNRHEIVNRGKVLIISSQGSTSHLKLFHLATRYYFGTSKKPILMPKFLCVIGLWLMNIFGYLINNPPFERPWMRHYIDKQLNIDNNQTCSLLGWSPDSRHLIERRIPFLVERLKSEPFAWDARNLVTLRRETYRPNLRIYTALTNAEDKIINDMVENVISSKVSRLYPHVQELDKDSLRWFSKLLYRLLLTSIDANNRMLILNYFEISGLSRFQTGYTADEIAYLLTMLNDTIVANLSKIDELKHFSREIYDYVSLPIEFGKDEVNHQYQLYLQQGSEPEHKEEKTVSSEKRNTRELLEETIWHCLVQRK